MASVPWAAEFDRRVDPKGRRYYWATGATKITPGGEVTDLDQAIAETNKADYGLTAGIFSRNEIDIARFFDEVEAGVCYVNKRTGATTGAWPGAQPFTGWKGSGSSGKGGCGPYYVAQFMREQSRTVIEP